MGADAAASGSQSGNCVNLLTGGVEEVVHHRWHILAEVATSRRPMRILVYLCDQQTQTKIENCAVVSEREAEEVAQNWAILLGIPLDDIDMYFLS